MIQEPIDDPRSCPAIAIRAGFDLHLFAGSFVRQESRGGCNNRVAAGSDERHRAAFDRFLPLRRFAESLILLFKQLTSARVNGSTRCILSSGDAR